jgi:metallo-beta-lactamase class B
MQLQIFKKNLLLVGLLLMPYLAPAQKTKAPASPPPEWSKPYPPFQIAGNLYYVGTYDLACYLIVTPKGNILINTGLASSAPILKANIETLGFKLTDTKILLNTQAHYDHMGAMAAIKKMTGAKLMIDAGDSSVVSDGGRSDYAFGGNANSYYAPVKIDRILHNGDIIKLGGMQLVMLHHPGHTKGSCSYLFNVKDKKRTYKVLIANMPSIVTNKKFAEIPTYPNISKDYAYTLAAMKKLKFDIWLASHASQFDLYSKHKPGSVYNPTAFIDRKGYDEALNGLQDQYLRKINRRR